MDTTNQNPQDDSQGVQPTNVQQDPATQSVQVKQPIVPTGSMNKESGSLPSQAVEYSITPSEPGETAPLLDQEVTEAGVEHSVDPTELHLTEEHANAGIAPAKESVPVLQTPQVATPQIKNAPFTPEEATEILKKTPTDDTKHWLAVLFLMVSKKMHMATT